MGAGEDREECVVMALDSCSGIGKRVRLSRILKDGKGVVFAFDHGFEHGPSDFAPERSNPRKVVELAVESGVDALMLTRGVAQATADIWAGRVPVIVKLTGKTSLRPPDMQMQQYRIGFVEDAVAMGADGVAATVYWGAPGEDAMAEEFAAIVSESERFGLPVMILAYPRGPSIIERHDEYIVKYASRASVEIGADIIKTHYTGSTESFRRVVESVPVPVLMSGGAKTEDPKEFLRTVKSVMDAGGAGVVVGRNVFQSQDFVGTARAILEVVHKGADPERL